MFIKNAKLLNQSFKFLRKKNLLFDVDKMHEWVITECAAHAQASLNASFVMV